MSQKLIPLALIASLLLLLVTWFQNRSLGLILSIIAIALVAAFGLLTWLERERIKSELKAQHATRRENLLSKANRVPRSSLRTEESKLILEYLNMHYTNSELDLERACNDTRIDSVRLSAILKEQVGTTFLGYVTDLRLSEANRVLSETDLQIKEIAQQTGFGNEANFNQIYKQNFGITPAVFRRNTQKRG